MRELPVCPRVYHVSHVSRLPGRRRTQDAVDLAKMVQVVCRFQADELLDGLASAYLVDPVALDPPCARDGLQQPQVALAQRPKDPRRKARVLLRVTQALCPCGLIPPRQGHAWIRQHVSYSPPHRQLRVRQVGYDLGDGPLFRCGTPDQLLGRDIAQSTVELGWSGLLDADGILIAKIAQDAVSVGFEGLCHWSSRSKGKPRTRPQKPRTGHPRQNQEGILARHSSQ